MTIEINESTELAYEGGAPLTTTLLVAPQSVINPACWRVLVPTLVTGSPMNPVPEPPARWADALITDGPHGWRLLRS